MELNLLFCRVSLTTGETSEIMDRFFGKSKKEEVSLTDTITKVKNCYFILSIFTLIFLFKLDGRVDSIEVKIKKLDAELAQCRDKMARLPEGSSAKNSIKQQAMRILQQKRMYENQRGMMMQQSFNMEQTNFATESIKDTVTVVQAMKAASKDMKKTMRKLDISQIEVK